MFNVNRYDPDELKRKRKPQKKAKKQKRQTESPSLPEIAKPVDAPERRPVQLQEALDDLDHDDELIEVEPTEIELPERPIEELSKGWKLPEFLVQNLRRDGFENFFPIQSVVIPEVIATERHAHLRVQDICITAPTGSGKTLSYVLPILNSLAQKAGPRYLRALVVLPSRDLAIQVHKVFESYVIGSRVKVGLAIGQTDFIKEQKELTVDKACPDIGMLRNRLLYDPTDLVLAQQILDSRSSGNFTIPANGWSNIDVLVCTPGRLVDHLENTRGFTLQHLRFLVVDEADRLLSQSYHKWIDKVLTGANAGSVNAWKAMKDGTVGPLVADRFSYRLEPITWRRGGVSGDDSDTFNTNDASVTGTMCQPMQLRKFLVSATLTRDPQKLAALRLVNPKHFDVHQIHSSGGGITKYSVPDALEEYTVECTAEQKPLVLLSLLLDRQQNEKNIIVVFTASLDSTHRLARLLQLLWSAMGYGSDTVGEFSSSLKQKDRMALVERCNDPEDSLSVVVCSDGMSRGMDIESVGTVINYDVPSLAKTYVHRCGRTARASRKGTAISILKGGQVHQYKRMRQIIQDDSRVQKMAIRRSLVRDSVGMYGKCIQALREVLSAEENGELGRMESVEHFVPR